ncbi:MULTISPECIES: Rgg/GadR/MutR family transcriptional regulator [unclassified Lactococcus]|uniref:Rgg/GadR/MutR family transcriptional regulator n=1 Tax=unclassified Lactococcus TaxID=2643510 RepID=UPI00164EFA11|nr:MULTISPECIES: Rgg/GadR/MutR family transcriptional regulator [unclassified Lactococcus]
MENMDIKKMGQTFKDMRESLQLPLKAFDTENLSYQTITAFEAGKSLPKLDKLEFALKVLGIDLTSFLDVVENQNYYQRYGRVFRSLREQRGFETTDFTDLGLSPLMLDLFEEGKIMPPLNKIDDALQKMHIPLSDFSFFLNNGSEEVILALFHKLDYADCYSNFELIQQLYDEAKNQPDFYYFSLAAKACLEIGLTENEAEEVTTFLFGLDDWTLPDIYCYIHVAQFMTTKALRSFTRDFTKHPYFYEYRPTARKLVTQAVLETCFTLVERDEFMAAIGILERVKDLLLPRDEYSRLSYLFTKGYYIYKKEHNDDGVNQMEEVIRMIKNLGDTALYQKFVKAFNSIR